MAARKNLSWTESTREKIKTSQLINRLQAHIDGHVYLSPTQVKSIDILLKKTLPDLSDVKMEVGAQPVMFNFDLRGTAQIRRDPLMEVEFEQEVDSEGDQEAGGLEGAIGYPGRPEDSLVEVERGGEEDGEDRAAGSTG